jgi:hypothetical protein
MFWFSRGSRHVVEVRVPIILTLDRGVHYILEESSGGYGYMTSTEKKQGEDKVNGVLTGPGIAGAKADETNVVLGEQVSE